MRVEYPENDLRCDRDLYVRELQTHLRQIALTDARVPLVTADGVFGCETTAAVKAAQQCAHLAVTGRVDFATWNAIVRAARAARRQAQPPLSCAPFTRLTSPLCEGECGEVVPFAQAMFNGLCERFCNFESEEVGDTMTETTCRNVKKIQQICEQKPTGVLDEASWNGLVCAFNTCATDRYITEET